MEIWMFRKLFFCPKNPRIKNIKISQNFWAMKGDNFVGLDHNSLRMFEVYQFVHASTTCEVTAKTLHLILDKIDQFDGEMYQNTSGCIKLNKILVEEMIGSFVLAVCLEICGL